MEHVAGGVCSGNTSSRFSELGHLVPAAVPTTLADVSVGATPRRHEAFRLEANRDTPLVRGHWPKDSTGTVVRNTDLN